MAVSEPELYDFAFRCVVHAVVHCIIQSTAPRAGMLSGGQSGGGEIDSLHRVSTDRQTESVSPLSESHTTERGEIADNTQYRPPTTTGQNGHADDTHNASLHSMTPTVIYSEVSEPVLVGSVTARIQFENQMYNVPPRGIYVSKFLRQIYQDDEGISSTEQHTVPVSRSYQTHSDTSRMMSRSRNHQRSSRFEEDFDGRRQVPQQMDGLYNEWNEISSEQYGDLEGNENKHHFRYGVREKPSELRSRENSGHLMRGGGRYNRPENRRHYVPKQTADLGTQDQYCRQGRGERGKKRDNNVRDQSQQSSTDSHSFNQAAGARNTHSYSETYSSHSNSIPHSSNIDKEYEDRKSDQTQKKTDMKGQTSSLSTGHSTVETGQVRQVYSRHERDRQVNNRKRQEVHNRRERNRLVHTRQSPVLHSRQDRGQEINTRQNGAVHCRSERDGHITAGERDPQFNLSHNRENNGSGSSFNLANLSTRNSGQSEEHRRNVDNATEGGRIRSQVDTNPGPLATLFQQLLHQFYQEVMMWIFVTTVWHPDQENLRHMLNTIADIIQEPCVSVTTSMVQGFMVGTSISHAGHFQLLIQILNSLTAYHLLSPTLTSLFRVQSVVFSINLAPRQLLHRFSDIVRNAMIVMIQQHSARIIDQPGCPGTRRRTRDRNSGPQNEIAPETRAFQPPHLMNPRQIHPASLHPHIHGAPQQVMFDMEQVPVSTPVSMTPYAIPVCTGPHLPVCTGAHHPVCSTAPTWSIPGCGVPLPSCNMQHIPTCSLPQIPFHPGSIPPLFHHHPAANHIPPQHLAPPTHFNPSARGHSEEEVSGLLDQRSRFPLHPGTLHPHGATPFTASAPVMLQEPHVHPTPHDIYGPFQRHFARQRTSGRNGRLRSLPLPPPPYPGFLLHFLAMLGNPPM
ncbi:uncharacterized protein LOC133192699 isoform X2 [Saccostrea echinata]|nr:uncharacterized protein LOC133192699 isoform X2 [Saccostrea echinata]